MKEWDAPGHIDVHITEPFQAVEHIVQVNTLRILKLLTGNRVLHLINKNIKHALLIRDPGSDILRQLRRIPIGHVQIIVQGDCYDMILVNPFSKQIIINEQKAAALADVRVR